MCDVTTPVNPQYPPDPNYPVPYPPQSGTPYPVVVPTSGLAVASLVFGVIGFLGGWCMFAIPNLVAIALGHVALRETRNGARGGHGLAVAGLILAYVSAVPWLLMAFWGVVGGLTAPFTD